MDKKDQQNFMLAIGLTLVIMMLAQVFLWGPNEKARQAEAARLREAQQEIAAPGAAPAPELSRSDVIRADEAIKVRVRTSSSLVGG